MSDILLAERAKAAMEKKHREAMEHYRKWYDEYPEARANDLLVDGIRKLRYGIHENKPELIERAYEMIIAGSEWLYVNSLVNPH